MGTYEGYIKKLKDNQILLFGGNREFRHGKGNALLAMKIAGAVYGKGGIQNQSMCLVTKDLRKRKHPSVPKEEIIEQLVAYYKYANENPDKEILVPYRADTENLCAYTPQEMADIFSANKIPENFFFEIGFSKLLNSNKKIGFTI